MATIREVAEQAQVSVATVSHVINRTRFVDPETQARVRQAIQTLGYRPNLLARSLRYCDVENGPGGYVFFSTGVRYVSGQPDGAAIRREPAD